MFKRQQPPTPAPPAQLTTVLLDEPALGLRVVAGVGWYDAVPPGAEDSLQAQLNARMTATNEAREARAAQARREMAAEEAEGRRWGKQLHTVKDALLQWAEREDRRDRAEERRAKWTAAGNPMPTLGLPAEEPPPPSSGRSAPELLPTPDPAGVVALASCRARVEAHRRRVEFEHDDAWSPYL
jgi:hypothetical protein